MKQFKEWAPVQLRLWPLTGCLRLAQTGFIGQAELISAILHLRRMEKEMSYEVGELVGVPCTIQPGPFPDELVVTVETSEGQISGFVKQSNLQIDSTDPEHGRVTGMVVEATDDSITVKLYGSFFTTAQGIASVSRSNLTRMQA